MTYLRILPASEALVFDTPPTFDYPQQRKFFRLPKEWTDNQDFRSPITHVGFVLAAGYFRHSGKFFSTSNFPLKDVEYVKRSLGYLGLTIQWDAYTYATQSRHQQLIRDRLGWQSFRISKGRVEVQTRQLVQDYLRPRAVLEALLKWLQAQRIEIPTYHAFEEVISQQYRRYELELMEALQSQLTAQQQQLMDNLLRPTRDPDPEESSFLSGWKVISHSTRPRQITQSVAVFRQVCEFCQQTESLILQLDLSPVAIRYFATWVQKASLRQLRQSNQRYLYLLAFGQHQFRIRQDLLVDVLLQSVQSTRNTLKKTQQSAYFSDRLSRNQAIQQAVASRQHLRDQREQARTILRSDWPPEQKLQALADLFLSEEAELVLEERIQILSDELNRSEQQEWNTALETRFLWLNNRVAALLKAVHFDPHTSDGKLLAAVNHFRLRSEAIDRGGPPMDWIPEKSKSGLSDQAGKLRGTLYKVLLFERAAEAIRSGALNLHPSYRYASIGDYLLSATRWQQEKQQLLQSTGLIQYQNASVVKQELERKLDEQYNRTNQRILGLENKHFKFSRESKPQVETPKVEKEDLDLVSSLFDMPKPVAVLDMLRDVEQSTGFLKHFEHFTLKNSKDRPSDETFFAVLLAYGCNIGTQRMASVSKGINAHTLQNTAAWYFTPETMTVVNNHLLSYLAGLGLANLQRAQSSPLHTSSDGQKFGVAVDSLNANYSYKYFGHGRGSTVYNFIDERFANFYLAVISSSEREAPYVIDGLLANEVIKSDIHSTDTHGFSEIIFALTHLLGFYFAPRIKDFASQQLYGFKSRKHYQELGYQVLPDKYINWSLIEENWDAILRLAVTLATKQVTASQLLKRLSAYSIQHPLYRALKELGKAIKTLFLLRYMDDLALRQSIEKQLNKVELSHKFAKAVFFGNNQEFTVGAKEEQELVAGCRRFIQNAIVLWNYLYLSQKIIGSKTQLEKDTIIEMLRNGSIMVWKHINLHGEYDFTTKVVARQFDMEQIQSLKFDT